MNRFRLCARGLALAVVFAVLCGFNVQSRAGIIIPGNEQAHIDYAYDPIFQAVGSVAGWDGTNWRLVGSGVLIDESWVMLTGHQVTRGYEAYRFSLGNDLFQPHNGRSIAEAYYYNGSGGNLFSPDLALLKLQESITSVTPAVIYQGNDLAVGMHIAFAGYGLPGYYPTGELAFDGLKRAGENIISEVGPNAGMSADRFKWDFGPANGTPSLSLEMNGSNYHSGGGVFANIDDQWQLVGIMTQVVPMRSTFAIRPDAYSIWTNQVMSVPEPSSLVLAMTGVAGIWMILRRR